MTAAANPDTDAGPCPPLPGTEGLQTHHTVHTVEVDAPPAAAYAVVADASRWAAVFPPTIHVEVLHRRGAEERLQVHALAEGQARTWTSWRMHCPLDRDGGRVSFRQEVPAAPLAGMSGAWVVRPREDGGSRVLLHHAFAVVGDDVAGTALVHRAVERNSASELTALAAAAARTPDSADVPVEFADTLQIRASAEQVYDVLYRADLWPQRLPHVAGVELSEERQGVQDLLMQTRSPDGSLHTTRSVRVCVPSRLIAYKQTETPPIMAVHAGRWTIEPAGPDAVQLTSHHSVVLRPEMISQLLGPDVSLVQARERVRTALGGNSLATMDRARELCESRGQARP